MVIDVAGHVHENQGQGQHAAFFKARHGQRKRVVGGAVCPLVVQCVITHKNRGHGEQFTGPKGDLQRVLAVECHLIDHQIFGDGCSPIKGHHA